MNESTATVWRDWPRRWMNRMHAQARLKDNPVFLMPCQQGERRPGGVEGRRRGARSPSSLYSDQSPRPASRCLVLFDGPIAEYIGYGSLRSQLSCGCVPLKESGLDLLC
jgi:hypothetical protein